MRILFLAASPDDQARLRLDKEHNQIQARLNEIRDPSVELILEAKWAVRPQDLSAALLDVDPDIVHFSGHGGTEGILLENDDGESVQIESSALAETLEIVGKNVRCVVLNACLSAEHATALADKVGFVVGTNATISDKAAIAFAAGFYRALSRGLTLEEAFALGKNEIALLNLKGADTPQIVMNAEVREKVTAKLEAPAKPFVKQPPPSPTTAEEPQPAASSERQINVFVSKPSAMTTEQDRLWTDIRGVLSERGIRYRSLGDTDFPVYSPLEDVVGLLEACDGAMILGFSQMSAADAVAKEGTVKRRPLGAVRLATPWNHMESSIAFALGMPLFIIREADVLEEGMLDRGSLNLYIHTTDLSQGWATCKEFMEPFNFWLGQVQHYALQKALEHGD